MSASVPRVVIGGGGFAGIEAAKALARAPAEIVLLDRQNHHCFQPLLYQVATAALSPADVAWPIRHILRRQRNATVLLAEITGIDVARKLVHTNAGDFPYDFLVVATGAAHSYFGHDTWAEVAPGLKCIEDATHIRRRILLAFERAEAEADATVRPRLLTFVIVGGGPTGVEMAGAIAEVARLTLAREFRRIDPRRSRIVLVEAGARLFPAFAADLAEKAKAELARMGVEVRLETMVTECDETGASTSRERIDAATIVWAAGVVASPAAAWLQASHDRAGRVVVEPDLSLAGHPNIFVIGDTAAVAMPDGATVPGLAPAAKQMGRYAGRLISARLAAEAGSPPFRFRNCGVFATIGRKSALAQMGRLHLTGFIGWLLWSVAHIYVLIGVRNRLVVAVNWLWEYLTFQRGARLITNIDESRTSNRPSESRNRLDGHR
jgi:NADH:ubiquinone reductase (H+-translocating)